MPSASHNPKDGGGLALIRCPECGYSLEGLASKGACPECGWEFTAADVVLYGWTERDHQARRINYAILAFVIVIVMGLVLRNLPASEGPFVGSVLIAIGLFGLLLRLLFIFRAKRAKGGNPGPWQLRFGPRGYGRRFGNGHLKLVPWSQMIRIEAIDNGDGHWAFLVVRWIRTFNWRLKHCKVAAESVPVIQVYATTNDIRELMERISNWTERRLKCEGADGEQRIFCVSMGATWPDRDE